MTYPIFQQAYLFNDIDVAIQSWHDLFGAGPFVQASHHKTDRFDYRGTDHEADVSYAFGYLGDTQIQFITQHDDTPSIYRDMFEPGEEGFHHVGCLVHDFEAEFARMQSLGFECATRLYADGVDAAYFDTRDVNGCFTEIHGDPPRIMSAFAQWHRAHVNMQPGDSPFLVRNKDQEKATSATTPRGNRHRRSSRSQIGLASTPIYEDGVSGVKQRFKFKPNVELDVQTGPRWPKWTTLAAAACLVAAIFVGVSALSGSDDPGPTGPARGDFNVDIEQVEGLEGATFVRRCTADGFSAVISTDDSAAIRVKVVVRFETTSGRLLHVAQLPLVVVEHGEPTTVDLPYVAEQAPANLRHEEPICVATVSPHS